jgi:hypothetical protein
MKTKSLIVLASTAVIAFLVVGWIFSIYNTQVALANRLEAQNSVVEVTLDNMRKTLKNQHNVTNDFADRFLEVVKEQTQGRVGGGAIKLNVESANKLGIDSDLFGRLMASIQGELDDFARQQNTLVDIWREHNTFCQRMPNSIFVGSRLISKPEVISSTVTKEAVQSKKLDDNLFE